MNKKLVRGSLAGVAAIALAAGGTTFAAWSDFGNINDNSVGAGILKLNLNSGSGGASTPLSFGNLAPGMSGYSAVYVASSDGNSVPPADLFLNINNIRDYENGCGTNASEQAADPQCTSTSPNDGALGGELSRVLDMRVTSYAAPDALTCKGWVTNGGNGGDPGPVLNSTVLTNEEGNLVDPNSGVNQDVLISDSAHPLTKGQGVCVTFASWWPKNQDPAHSYDGATLPTDNAAQSDSLKFDAKFDLVQH